MSGFTRLVRAPWRQGFGLTIIPADVRRYVRSLEGHHGLRVLYGSRQNLAKHLNDVLESRAPVTITRQGKGDVVLLSAEEFAGMKETLHLLRSPANAERLLHSIRAARDGLVVEHDLVTGGEGAA